MNTAETQLIKRSTAYLASSLGAQLVLALLVAFVGMGLAGLWIVRTSVEPVFKELEQRSAYESVHRVMSAVQTEFNSLQLLTVDWAQWDDLANFVEFGDRRFAKSNLTPAALRKVNLTAMVAWDSQGRLVAQQNNEEPGRGQAVMDRLSGLYQSIRAVGERGCGFLKMQNNVIELCWETISPTERLDHKPGTLAFARFAGNTLWQRIASETQESIEVKPAVFRLADQSDKPRWFVSGLPLYTQQDVAYEFKPGELELTITLVDMRRIPLLDVQIHRQRDLAQEALYMMTRIFWQMLLGAVMVALFIWLLVRWRFVARISRMRKQLGRIQLGKDWGRGLQVDGTDELGRLSDHINTLLGIIHSQVRDLTSQSQTDALTALPNRRALDVYLKQEVELMRHEGSSMSLLMLDVDFFKQYNDFYGHPSGDEVLQRIGRVLAEQCRTRDLAVRMGGEEFAVLLPDTDAVGAMRVARSLCHAVEHLQVPHHFSAVSDWVTCSVGATTMQALYWNEAEFLREADQALYAAKAKGRNRCVHFKDVG
ncbi:diguanylate cyclase [Curvibacter sp. CHRR-16]|uniref:sensor domain-containing diguanylate cyclase n=1 Tax=Curvibacter sp. CHRR-16 TaxID=2835872 RepID=UPI001BDA7854|nr:diguanylate cyclase [Curvibacter sp. CHRR-16]MBT0571800.1 diguanylate cyclase [Curvibacter sp. CHRR-16]